MNNISPLAYVDPKAKLGDFITVNPFAYIDADVEIDDGSVIGPHVSIMSGARIGKNNRFYSGCVIAAIPQDFRWKGEKSYVKTGDNVTIREQVIINRSIYEGGSTIVGDDSFIMAQSHVAHDSEVGNFCIVGNSVKIAGSCKIGDYCILSSAAIVHENLEVGEWSLIKGGCRVTNNVPPFVIMAHNPISYFGVNSVILQRGKFPEELIDDIAKCYRHLYQSNTSAFNAMIRIKSDVPPSPVRDDIIRFVERHKFQIAALSVAH